MPVRTVNPAPQPGWPHLAIVAGSKVVPFVTRGGVTLGDRFARRAATSRNSSSLMIDGHGTVIHWSSGKGSLNSFFFPSR
nr:hypothetical protein [Sphingomonas ginkgonis]